MTSWDEREREREERLRRLKDKMHEDLRDPTKWLGLRSAIDLVGQNLVEGWQEGDPEFIGANALDRQQAHKAGGTIKARHERAVEAWVHLLRAIHNRFVSVRMQTDNDERFISGDRFPAVERPFNEGTGVHVHVLAERVTVATEKTDTRSPFWSIYDGVSGHISIHEQMLREALGLSLGPDTQAAGTAAEEKRARDWFRQRVKENPLPDRRKSQHLDDILEQFRISRRAAERVWDAEAPADWRKPGRRKKN